MLSRHVALAALLAAVALPAPAGAAVVWTTPPATVSPTDTAYANPLVAMNAGGDVTILFQRGTFFPATQGQAVSRPAGGPFGPVLDVTPSGGSPQALVMDAAGNAHAFWVQAVMGGSIVQTAVKPPNGPWGAATPLEASGNSFDEIGAAANAVGDVVAAWRDVNTNIVRVARRPSGGSFGAPFNGFNSGVGNAVAERPKLALNAAGDAAIAFRRRVGGGNFHVIAVFVAAGSTTPVTFNPGAGADDDDPLPGVGIDNAGNAAVLFERVNRIRTASKVAGAGAWSGAADVTTVGTASAPRMAVNGAGNAAAVWVRDGRVEATTRTGLGAFAAATPLSPLDGATYYAPEVAVDVNGTGLATYGRSMGTNSIESARTSGAAWTALPDVTADGFAPAPLAVDGQGNGVAAAATSGTAIIRAAGLDAAGPRLNDVVFPATAQQGTPFAYSVMPVDVWSTVSAVEWDFGDGSTAAGASGSHTYGAAGAFNATVTATDAFANSSTAVRSVAVGPPDDQCPSDPAKLAPGACGCGVPDTDANTNGVADCLVNADLKGSLAQLRTLLGALTGQRGATQAAIKAQVRALAQAIFDYVKREKARIAVTNTKAKIERLGRTLRDRARAAAKSRGGALRRARRRALTAVDALDGTVAPQ
jgi:hypothetical protein